MTTTDQFFRPWDDHAAASGPDDSQERRSRPRPAEARAHVPAPAVTPVNRVGVRLTWPPPPGDQAESPSPAAVIDTADDEEERPPTEEEQTPVHRPPRTRLDARGEEERAGGSAYQARDLSYDTLMRHRADVPARGWRRWLYLGSATLINPGIGPAEAARQALRARVGAPLRAPYRITVTSIKGGIGKTTTCACLGSALAEIRGDQVTAIDANPDAGTLADRLTGDNSVTIRDLLAHIDTVDSLTRVMSYMSLSGRLKVLASDQDPAISEALTGAEYELALRALSRYFNVVITDTGTGMTHSTMRPALSLADRVVVVGGVTIDGASRAAQTLDWLEHHGHGDKAASAVVVLNQDRRSGDVDTSRIVDHFRARLHAGGGAVVLVPHDPHLATGGLIDFGRLRQATQDAFIEVAAAIADRFPDQRPA